MRRARQLAQAWQGDHSRSLLQELNRVCILGRDLMRPHAPPLSLGRAYLGMRVVQRLRKRKTEEDVDGLM